MNGVRTEYFQKEFEIKEVYPNEILKKAFLFRKGVGWLPI